MQAIGGMQADGVVRYIPSVVAFVSAPDFNLLTFKPAV